MDGPYDVFVLESPTREGKEVVYEDSGTGHGPREELDS